LIRRATAVRFDRTEPSGRTEPLRIAVVTDDGVEHDVFLKPSGRPDLGIEGMANEALAAMLAADLGLPVCEPLLVALDPAFIASIPDPAARAVLQQSSPVCFASKSAGQQWPVWNPGERLLSDRIPMALAITAFDAFVLNVDRGPSGKANLLVKGDQFRIIDHELTFRLRTFIPRPQPWRVGEFNSLLTPPGHVLAVKLKKMKDLDFQPIKDAWTALSDAQLESYVTNLPAEWSSAKPFMDEAISHLKQIRDRIDECLAELVRVLT
jgi:hypothetical protein